MFQLTIGDVVIEPFNQRDTNDCIFLAPDGITGFSGATSDKGEQVERMSGDGALSLDGFLSAGLLTLSGGLIAPTPEALVYKRDRLIREFTGKEIVVSAHDEGGRFWRYARRQGLPEVERDGRDRCFATFTAQLWLPDPHYYGATRSVAPGVIADNRGNADAIPVLRVTGPLPSGYTVRDGAGGEVVVTQALPSGGVDVIDLRTGWVRRAGVVVSGAVSKFQPWVIPAYGTKVHTFSGPAAQLRVEVTDTFM